MERSAHPSVVRLRFDSTGTLVGRSFRVDVRSVGRTRRGCRIDGLRDRRVREGLVRLGGVPVRLRVQPRPRRGGRPRFDCPELVLDKDPLVQRPQGRRGVLDEGVHFLQKPFSPDALVAALEEMVADT